MKKLSRIIGIIVLLIVVSITFSMGESVLTQRNKTGYGQDQQGKGFHRQGGFWSKLTDEQRETIQKKIEDMRSKDASRDEIRAAVAEMLKGYGIDLPENWEEHQGFRRFGRGRPGFFGLDLTAEQREAVRAKIKEMRDNNASREEIHAVVKEILEGYGIDVPENFGKRLGPNRFGAKRTGFRGIELTNEQREAVHAKAKEMREQGATREEIHAAVKEMLEGYGIELPENWGEHQGFNRFGRGRPDFQGLNLTAEQREAINKKRKEMREQGATREETHAAIKKMLEGYGIELPENWGELQDFRNFGRGHHHHGFFGLDLTVEQRKALQTKIKEMREQGATREEIHAAVKEMLEGYGVELPENWGEPQGFKRFGRRCHGFFGKNLTEDQRITIREKIKEMRSQDATHKEIHDEILKMLEEWGIEQPDNEPENDYLNQDKKDPALKSANFPNPFNPVTTISYTLPNDEQVTIRIYNIEGQLIRTLVNSHQPAGNHTVDWDGCNDSGEKVVSGMYFYRIDAGKQSVTQRMIMIK